MYVMGGGRVAPNPSTEVDVYNPGTNSWSNGLPFTTARRNFPTDTNGTDHIWLSGGYASDGITPLSSMEIFCQGGGTPTPTPTATATATATVDRNCNCDCDGHRHSIANCDGHRHSISPTATLHTGNSGYPNTAASANTTASPITAVAASLPATPKLREGGCEAQPCDDCKCG